MKSLPAHLKDFLERRKMIEEDLRQTDESYQGPIKNYPVIYEMEYHDFGLVTEGLTLSGPSKNVIRDIKKKIYGIKSISTRPLGCHAKYVRPSENKSIRIEIHEKDFEEQKDKLEKLLEFWGFYINSFDNEREIPVCVIYPKFQSEFLLDHEKYLVHVTSTIYLNKIHKQGLKPYSKLTKYKNVFNYTHNLEVLKLYEKLPESWSPYNHPDKVHFFIGSQTRNYLTGFYLSKFFGTLGSELTFIVVDVSKLPRKMSFCEDPNSTLDRLVTVYTMENISPETIVYTDNVTSEMSQKEITEHLNKLYNFVENKQNNICYLNNSIYKLT